MFQSYKYIKYLGYDKAKNEHSHQYKIIDSDFEDVGVGVGVGVEVGGEVGVGVEVEVAVIDTYEKRNLPVAKNLMLAIFYTNKKYPYYSVQQIIEANRNYNNKFAKYEQELNKYLCLV